MVSKRPILRAAVYDDGYNVRPCALENALVKCEKFRINDNGEQPRGEGLELEIFLTVAREAGFDVKVWATEYSGIMNIFSWLSF